MKNAGAENLWQKFFLLYGVLSLSSMAGMGIGSGLFLAASLYTFFTRWQAGGAARVREAFSTPYSWLSLALFASCLISLVAAYFFPVEGSQQGPVFSSLKKFHYFLYPPITALAFLQQNGKIEEHRFWYFWGGMGAFVSLVAIIQFFGADLFPEAWLHNDFFRPVWETRRFHGQGLMFFHLSFASCLCFVAAISWARLYFPLAQDGWQQRFLWAALALLASLGVYFSYSRIALAALGLLPVFLGFLRKPKFGVVALLVLIPMAWMVWSFSPSLQLRFVRNEGGTFERKMMWHSAFLMFADRPLTGVGFSRTGEFSPIYATRILGVLPGFTSHAHDNFLDMLASTGMLGTLAFVAWWIFLFWGTFQVYRHSPPEKAWLPAGVLAGFFAFHVNGITQVNFWDGKSEHTLMLFVGLALALWLRDKRGRTAV